MHLNQLLRIRITINELHLCVSNHLLNHGQSNLTRSSEEATDEATICLFADAMQKGGSWVREDAILATASRLSETRVTRLCGNWYILGTDNLYTHNGLQLQESTYTTGLGFYEPGHWRLVTDIKAVSLTPNAASFQLTCHSGGMSSNTTLVGISRQSTAIMSS